MNTKRIGDFGEREAEKHLRKNGYKIVERNVKTKFCEVDIIAYDGDTLCIIEVKTRSRVDYGMAWESVDYKKQQKMIKGAKFYISVHNLDVPVRFDIVEVYIKGSCFLKAEKINIIRNAFFA